MLKILEIVPSLSLGGIEKQVFNLSKSIDRERFKMEILSASEEGGEYLEPIISLGIPVQYFCKYHRKPIRFFCRYFIMLRARRYDVVHVHLNYWSAPFVFLSWLMGTPKRICHFHNTFDQRKHLYPFKHLYPICRVLITIFSTRIVGVSDTALRSVFGVAWPENRKIRRIFNGVEIEKFCRAEKSQTLMSMLGIKKSTLILGHVGGFREQKNHAFLVEIAKVLREWNTDFVFLLIGEGYTLPSLKKIAKENALDHYFIFTGGIRQVHEYMKIMDIFVFPSLYEGFGLAVIEAQAAGLPVVTSNSIPAELPLIEPSVRLPLGKPEEWAKVIRRIADGISHRADAHKSEVITSGKLREFSVECWVSKIEELYDEEMFRVTS